MTIRQSKMRQVVGIIISSLLILVSLMGMGFTTFPSGMSEPLRLFLWSLVIVAHGFGLGSNIVRYRALSPQNTEMESS